jgi:hypothetical protein
LINIDDEWREFLSARAGDPLPAATSLTPDSYCTMLHDFSSRLAARSKEARSAWDAVVRSFGRSGGQSLANFRKFHGRSFAGEPLSALEGQWAAYLGGSDLLRLASEHPANMPVPQDLLKALAELRLRERTLLAANTASLMVKHSITKGDAVVQQMKNVLIGHQLDQTSGMGMLDEISDRTGALAHAARGAPVDLAWLGQHAEKLARLLEAIDRHVKWQSEQPALKSP